MAVELSIVTEIDINQNAYELRPAETLTSAGDGESVLLPIRPDGRREAAVTLSGPASWSAKVQATNSTVADVRNDTAVWFDWPDGVVSATTNRIIYNATAVRQVNSAGTSKMEVNS